MKKPKKKKKSKLQKKIDDPNSKLWRNKADKLWKELVFLCGEGKCAICGSKEWVQAHHLIPREMTSHRHCVHNVILLCASHHKYSFDLSPHKAPVAFFGWIIKNNYERWTWLLEQEPSREHGCMDFKNVVTDLQIQTNQMLSSPKTNVYPGS
jgi:5-methylcytosine-specific restriction endonuclease McrA